ncbi:MAG: glycosyltransferase family 2 protein [Clostridioides sp.]|jgi:glycosyltransferase involved in cell wall biosynthesis|nr:glycosyltransferase family 2 protein [Clostridioides sp.]
MNPKVAVIIPAYNPSDKLVSLVCELKNLFSPLVIVVDDGNSVEMNEIWDELIIKNCIVLHHRENKGKGVAIKTAISYLLSENIDIIGYVTADSDYQHRPNDICRVAKALQDNPDKLILGVRNFSKECVPFRSKIGNMLASKLFHLETGIGLTDTQTGLRGVPMKYAEFSANISVEMKYQTQTPCGKFGLLVQNL